MSKQPRKPTGLANFTAKPTPPMSVPAKKGKGASGVITFPVRLNPEQWERARQLAASERTSLQALAVLGLSKIFEEKGLAPL